MPKKCPYYHTPTCSVVDAVEFDCTECHKKVWKAKLLIDLFFTGYKNRVLTFGKVGDIVNITTMNGLYGIELGSSITDGFCIIDKKDLEFIGQGKPLLRNRFELLKDS